MGIVVTVGAAALVLAACGDGKTSQGAAGTASRLMAATLRQDRVAFEAEIDRHAVREDLRRQMQAVGAQNDLQVDGGPSDFALDRMISPGALRLVSAGAHEALTAAPTAAQLAPMLKDLDGKRVCLKDVEDHDRCLLTFARSKREWRLVGMQAMARDIPVQTGD